MAFVITQCRYTAAAYNRTSETNSFEWANYPQD